MSTFSIKDVENLSGVKAHTIRIWEQRYNFLNPNRSFTNIRAYSNEELKELLNVALLNKYGYKISTINNMTSIERKEKILSINEISAQYDRILNELLEAMMDLKLDIFESIINRFILASGIDHAVKNILFPFLNKIGLLWQTDIVQPAQEHILSNIIRQKLIVGIENTLPKARLNTKILLYLPEGEKHEIGLLYMYFKLKTLGAEVIYLGAESTLTDIEYVIKNMKPNYLYTHLTAVKNSFNLEKYSNEILAIAHKQKIVFSGKMLKMMDKISSKKITYLYTNEELENFVMQVSASTKVG